MAACPAQWPDPPRHGGAARVAPRLRARRPRPRGGGPRLRAAAGPGCLGNVRRPLRGLVPLLWRGQWAPHPPPAGPPPPGSLFFAWRPPGGLMPAGGPRAGLPPAWARPALATFAALLVL